MSKADLEFLRFVAPHVRSYSGLEKQDVDHLLQLATRGAKRKNPPTRDDVLEEAACVAEKTYGEAYHVAAAIRALKETSK